METDASSCVSDNSGYANFLAYLSGRGVTSNLQSVEQSKVEAPSSTDSTSEGELKERERWSSRAAFYFAAIGSAVGFGNIWRFPSLVYEYGGGAFFVAYALAVILIGLPILVLEISLGQYYETGDVDVFGGIHRRLRGIGLLSVTCGYMVLTYYSMLISWVSHAFFDSFSNPIWVSDEVTGSDAKGYFFNSVIGMETLGEDLKPTRVVWTNVGCSFLTWTLIYLCVAFGVRWTGRIAFFTMGFPLILLFIFLGRAVTLEGSQDGIARYLECDWSVLIDNPQVWVKAVTQVFFSLSITFGIMTAYGSHCHRDEPAFKNATIIALADSLYSFVSGFAVFATLGYVAYLNGVDINDLEYSGFGLVFGTWPVALGTLPGGIHWVRVLFVMLFFLGLDSAFSFMDGFLICLSDTAFLGHVNTKYSTLGLTVVAWLLSFMYATDAGLIFLDTIDYYINFVMLLVGGTECFAAGWIYNIEEQVDNLGASIVFSFMTTIFGSVILACILWFGISDKDTALWAGFLGLVIFFVLGMSFVCYLMHKKKQEQGLWSWRSMFYDLMFRNVMDLRDDLSGVVGYMPVAWAVLVKYFIPPVLIVIFSLGCAAKTSTGESVFGHYEGYPLLPYQLLGILIVVLAGFLFFSSLIMPQLYSAFQKSNSPVPSKDATIHAAPKHNSSNHGVDGYGVTSFSLNSGAARSVWPPRSISTY